jgi:hypothetical protein
MSTQLGSMMQAAAASGDDMVAASVCSRVRSVLELPAVSLAQRLRQSMSTTHTPN